MGAILRMILQLLGRIGVFLFVFQWIWVGIQAAREGYARRKINALILFFVFIYIILVIKLITIEELGNGVFFAIYSIAVSFYILSRFLLAYVYHPKEEVFSADFLPTVSFGVPSKNEGGGYS